jgi:hypothetical protein
LVTAADGHNRRVPFFPRRRRARRRRKLVTLCVRVIDTQRSACGARVRAE